MAEGAGQNAMGYILGKVEGEDENWHGHVTALTVAPDFRYAVDSFTLDGTIDSKIMSTMSVVNDAHRAALLGAALCFNVASVLDAMLPCCCQAARSRTEPDGSVRECHAQAAQRVLCGPVCAAVKLQCHRHVH